MAESSKNENNSKMTADSSLPSYADVNEFSQVITTQTDNSPVFNVSLYDISLIHCYRRAIISVMY